MEIQRFDQIDGARDHNLAELEERNRQLSTLVEIGKRLRAAHTFDDISTAIVEGLQTLTGSPRVLVYLTDPDREFVRLHTHVGVSVDELSSLDLATVSVDEAERRTALFMPLGGNLFRAKQPLPGSPFEDCALLILADQQQLSVGCAVFDLVNCPSPLSNVLIQILEVFANKAASALTTARLLSEQQRTVDRLMALSAFSVAANDTSLSAPELMRMMVGGAVGTTRALGGGALLTDGDKLISYYESAPLRPCTAAIVALLKEIDEHAEYVEILGDAVPAAAREVGVGCLLCVPLRGTNLALGELWVAYSAPTIAAADREMVTLYAKTAGAVLGNMHLFDQLRLAHDRLASILESTSEGMLMVSESGEILVANAALGDLLGDKEATSAARSIDDVLAIVARHNGDAASLGCALRQFRQDTHAFYAGELHLNTPVDRDLVWSVAPARGSTAPTCAALLIVHDVTAEYQANKLRDNLAHMVVHDLRAPLANIIASLDLVLKQGLGRLAPREERILHIASEASHHLLTLVNALLDIRRLEYPQLELDRAPHRLEPIVVETIEQLEQMAQFRQITLQNEIEKLEPLLIDAELVRRVLQNLIDNAIKFSGERTTVRIAATIVDDAMLPPQHEAGRWALIQVIDQGRGVPEAYRTHIFELFGQTPHLQNQGSGIGLAFCKTAIAAHGGMIWVTDAPDGGAAFCFTLPVA